MTPYERNGKKPNRSEYLKQFGFQGDLLWRLDSVKYQDREDARKRHEENLKIQAQRAREENKVATVAPKEIKKRNKQFQGEPMAASNKQSKPAPESAPKNKNDGFVIISKTKTTVYQNSKGEKRKVTEITTAPNKQKKQSAPAQKKQAAKVSAAKPAKNGGKK